MGWLFRWIWASYQALAAYQWLLGLGSGAGGGWLLVLNFASDWPLWGQLIAAAGVALGWLTVLSWLLRMFGKPTNPTARTQSAGPQSPQAIAGRDITQITNYGAAPAAEANTPVDQGALDALGPIRDEGVRLRNLVQFEIDSAATLKTWVDEAGSWRDRAVAAARPLSVIDANFIGTLNRFKPGQAPVPNPIPEKVAGIEHQRWADMHNERLERLEQFMQGYRVAPDPRVSKDERPLLMVDTPDHVLGSGEYTLRVSNHGAAAEVGAVFKVIGGGRFLRDTLREYTGTWERTDSPSPKIRQGDALRLRVARLEIALVGEGASSNYAVHYWDDLNNRPNWMNTTNWFAPGDGGLHPVIDFQLTLTADPAPVDGAVIRYYRLDEHGLTELPDKP